MEINYFYIEPVIEKKKHEKLTHYIQEETKNAMNTDFYWKHPKQMKSYLVHKHNNDW